MIDEITANKIKSAFENKEFVEKFKEIEDFAEMKKLFADNGIEIGDEDLRKSIEALLEAIEGSKNSELTEEQMENVSGGFVGWLVLGAAAAVVGGVSAYKLRKTLNSATGTCKR